ncbi:protein of unknown function [Streptococcus thermophilus]|nr:protein of unknown function [Streptococcus thermophilus]
MLLSWGQGTGQIKLVKKSAIPLVMLWLRKCIKISLTRKSLAKVNKRSLVKNIMSKMMSTPQSKKGQEPKISVKDDQIVIDNGLKTVSPNIKPTSVKDTKAGFFLYSFDQKNKQTSNHKTSMKNFALFCFLLLPIYVIYLIFNNEKKAISKIQRTSSSTINE